MGRALVVEGGHAADGSDAVAFMAAVPGGAALPSAVLMVVAMTAPTWAGPLEHLWRRALARRRMGSVVGYLLAFIAMWTAGLLLLEELAGALARSVGSSWADALLAGAVALFWHGTERRGLAVAQCHWRPALPAFGLSSRIAPAGWGAGMACWCLVACGPLMLAAMVVPIGGHVPMALATLVMLVERAVPRRTFRRPLAGLQPVAR